MKTISGHKIKIHLEDMNKANSAILGISRILDDMHLADESHDKEHPFYNNGFIKGCLTRGIESLSDRVSDKLSRIRELAGISEDQ